jgi:hypothetical protein
VYIFKKDGLGNNNTFARRFNATKLALESTRPREVGDQLVSLAHYIFNRIMEIRECLILQLAHLPETLRTSEFPIKSFISKVGRDKFGNHGQIPFIEYLFNNTAMVLFVLFD